MLSKFRRRAEDEKGFTLIELLVVILIIGILAAIAIPSFLNQKSKANDAPAKEMARTAQTAAETYATDHNGRTPAWHVGAAGDRADAQTTPAARRLPAVHRHRGRTGYTVTATSRNGNTYTITRAVTGTTSRSCTPTCGAANSGGCVGGSW